MPLINISLFKIEMNPESLKSVTHLGKIDAGVRGVIREVIA